MSLRVWHGDSAGKKDFQGSNVVVHIDRLKAVGSAVDVLLTCVPPMSKVESGYSCAGSGEAVVHAVRATSRESQV